MTTTQRSVTWIVSIVVAYLIAAFAFRLPPFHPFVTPNISISTEVGNVCTADPLQMGLKPGEQTTFSGDGDGPYTIHFSKGYPFTGTPQDITVPKNGTTSAYTAQATYATNYYSILNKLNCKQETQDIGVIIKH